MDNSQPGLTAPELHLGALRPHSLFHQLPFPVFSDFFIFIKVLCFQSQDRHGVGGYYSLEIPFKFSFSFSKNKTQVETLRQIYWGQEDVTEQEQEKSGGRFMWTRWILSRTEPGPTKTWPSAVSEVHHGELPPALGLMHHLIVNVPLVF